jgi:hypothetical protein
MKVVRVIDQDPEMLRRHTGEAIRAGEEAWIHMEAEFEGNIPRLMETLRSEGPYAYSILPIPTGDGGLTMPIVTDYAGIEAAYKQVRGASKLHQSDPLVEIRTPWYAFHESVSHGTRFATGVRGETALCAMFPVSTDKGITGELLWVKFPMSMVGRGPRGADGRHPDAAPLPADPALATQKLRQDLIAQHDRFLAALRAADPKGMAETLNEAFEGAVRDYVDDTGTLVSLHGPEGQIAHYERFFKKYEIKRVDILYRVAQDWYVFNELRFELRRRDGGGDVAFHTAEMFGAAYDGRFMSRVGHGTDPATM